MKTKTRLLSRLAHKTNGGERQTNDWNSGGIEKAERHRTQECRSDSVEKRHPGGADNAAGNEPQHDDCDNNVGNAWAREFCQERFHDVRMSLTRLDLRYQLSK